MFVNQIFVLTLINYAYARLHLEPSNPAFDPSVYEDALDPELCQEHLAHIRNNTLLRLQYLGAGIRFPKHLLQGNLLDMGNYQQCLQFETELENSVIEGKYCLVSPKFGSSIDFETLAKALKWQEYDESVLLDQDVFNKIKENNKLLARIQTNDISWHRNGVSRDFVNPLTGLPFSMAVCVPKTCTSREGMTGLLLNLDILGIPFEDVFCRFKNDKPWAPVDYVAITILSLFGLLAILSTSYDVWHQIIAKKDPKTASTLYRSFSVYTNARRLTTFTSGATTLECVDGVRALAMMWVVVGHTYSTLPPLYNYIDISMYISHIRSLWITAAPYTVDTFFMLTGMLVVYTTAGKMSGMKLLKNLHLFYLNRILRMFPLLAVGVLLQASVFHRAVDGPIWITTSKITDDCRAYWWSTLLYVQNYVNPSNMCLQHTWYLAIDMQLYIICPIFLFWVLTDKTKPAWISLTAGVLISLTVGTTYSFINQFQGWNVSAVGDAQNYMRYYYYNTITRASPFFVGMVFGYLLHIWKGKKLDMPLILVLFLWACAVTTTSMAMYATHGMKDFTNEYDNPTLDGVVNSFARPMWAMAVGWVIFACQTGMGGPVNWILSLRIWKLPSRLSYGMYLFHYPILFMAGDMALQPIFYVEVDLFFESIKYIILSLGVSFALTLFIDSPCSILLKMVFGEGPKKNNKEVEDKE